MAKKKRKAKRCCKCPAKRRVKRSSKRRSKRVCAEVRVVCPARRFGKKVHSDQQSGRCYVETKKGRRFVKRIKKCVRGAKKGRFDSLGRQIRR